MMMIFEIITISSRFHIVNHNGRVEKSVTAHQGACLTAQWSPDGAGLLTGNQTQNIFH